MIVRKITNEASSTSNFKFSIVGPDVSEITLDDLTFLIGPNGSGKTVVLEALCRLFAFDPSLRRVQRSDFHVPLARTRQTVPPDESFFWLEAEFVFPELEDTEGEHATIPTHFAHMRMDDVEGVPRVRFRLDAKLDADGEIEDVLNYILDVDADSQPLTKHPVPRPDRNNIQVHYLPARRDPSDHIAYTANSLLGRTLRSANWRTERETIKDLTGQISDSLAGNSAVESLGKQLTERWQCLHKGSFFAEPQVTFDRSEVEALLRHLHKSKGLEFDSVVILGVENQAFWGKSDEERCAFFVGASRAKRCLVLTFAALRPRPAGFGGRWIVSRTPHQEFIGYGEKFE